MAGIVAVTETTVKLPWGTDAPRLRRDATSRESITESPPGPHRRAQKRR